MDDQSQEQALETSSVHEASTFDYKSLRSIDLGNLLVSDPAPFVESLNGENEYELINRATENTQALISEIFKLPTERVDNVLVAKLPNGTTRLPREKPVPKPRPPTKWETYAKMKGINKRKKGRKIWDEQAKEWRPRWGYKRAGDLKDNWVLEVPDNADPYEDQFAKLQKEKEEKISKNEFQRLKNIARARKININDARQTTPSSHSSKKVIKAQMQDDINVARVSTASMGKFDEKIPGEKVRKAAGQKRKFEPMYQDLSKEKDKSLKIVESILSKQPIVDSNRAANLQMASQQESSHKSRRQLRREAKRQDTEEDVVQGNKVKKSSKLLGTQRRSKQSGRHRGGDFSDKKRIKKHDGKTKQIKSKKAGKSGTGKKLRKKGHR